MVLADARYVYSLSGTFLLRYQVLARAGISAFFLGLSAPLLRKVISLNRALISRLVF